VAVNPNAFGAHAILATLASWSRRASGRSAAVGDATGHLDRMTVRVAQRRGDLRGRRSGELTLFTSAYALASLAAAFGASDR
jgi:hypothetical protein